MLGGGNLTLGYIENKRVNAPLSRLIDESEADPKAQIAKYLTLSDNLIFTDYLRFLRVGKAPNGKIQITQELTICALNEIRSILKSESTLQSKQSELLEFFALFFSSTPKPINTAQEFALCLAQRTKLVKDILIDNPQNPQISTLYQSFRDILYKDLDFEAFCDSFAQTLTYALFLARLNDENGETIDLYNAKKFIPKSFPLIRAMSGFLDNLDELDSLKWLIKEILGIINHIDPTSITKELNKIAQKDLLGSYLHKDPYLHFYETFLSQYDPKLRELRGVYYTPFAVVSFIINAIDCVLKSDFNQNKGLGSALNNDNITLLDFATGTGTFLLEAFRKALESTPQDSAHYKPKNLLSKFSGFEFLIAPYTIAHLKISQSFKEEFNAPLEDNEKLNILLTNTIYTKSAKDERNQKSSLFVGMYELAQEFLQSQKLKNEQILIITGNPPYSGASANKGIFEDEVKIAYGLEPNLANLSTQAQRIINTYFANPNEKSKQRDFKNFFESRRLQNEKNPKWLLDDYVKFIRFAESKIESQDSGIIAIISNHGFIDNPTFRGMRWHLLNTFDKIYILDLHGNVKKKEKSPNGSKDDNVFDIQQGVCISIFVKTNNQNKPTPPNIKVETPPIIKWETYSNTPKCKVYHYDIFGKRKDKYDFLQSNGLESIAWSEIAPKAPFYLFIPQDESLRNEYDKGISIKDIFKSVGVGITTAHDKFVIDFDKERLLQKFNDFRDSPPSASELHKKFNVKEKAGWDILKGWNNLQGESNLQKYIQKIAYRPFDMRYIFYEEKLVWRCVKDIMQHFENQHLGLIFCRQVIGKEFQHSFIVDTIMESCYISNRTKEINYIAPLYLIKSDSRSENLTDSFRNFIDTKYGEHFSPEVILGYIYAVLFHKDYREKFVDFLKIDFPRIPFVENEEQFLALSALGEQIIELHLMRGEIKSISEPRFEKPQNRNEKIEKITYNADKKRLYVNESLYFSNVDKEVWEYKIGGYAVLDKYLKSHKAQSIDYIHFECVISILQQSLSVESQIAKIELEC